eukprot:5904464-Prymnesium_polylepis.2
MGPSSSASHPLDTRPSPLPRTTSWALSPRSRALLESIDGSHTLSVVHVVFLTLAPLPLERARLCASPQPNVEPRCLHAARADKAKQYENPHSL